MSLLDTHFGPLRRLSREPLKHHTCRKGWASSVTAVHLSARAPPRPADGTSHPRLLPISTIPIRFSASLNVTPSAIAARPVTPRAPIPMSFHRLTSSVTGFIPMCGNVLDRTALAFGHQNKTMAPHLDSATCILDYQMSVSHRPERLFCSSSHDTSHSGVARVILGAYSCLSGGRFSVTTARRYNDGLANS